MTTDNDNPLGGPEPTKQCVRCKQCKPPSAFRSAGQTMCLTCTRNVNHNRRNKSLRDALMKLATGQIVAATRGDRLDAPRISQLCALMVDKMGGLNRFCQEWADQIKLVLANEPGSRTALDSMRTIAKLVRDSTSSVDAASSTTSLSDEELDQAVTEMVSAAIAKAADDPALIECDSGPIDGADDYTEDESDDPDDSI